jgi:hypothetical protein
MWGYYEKLYDSLVGEIPLHHLIFEIYYGESDSVDYICNLYEEGLITSYPIEKVLDFLRTKISKYSELSGDDRIKMEVVSNNIQKLSDDLNKKLFVYGYCVAKTVPLNTTMFNLIIDKIHPRLLDEDEKLGDYYHITYKKFLDKIQKIGLLPKNSSTIFTHPGGRIYLIQTQDVSLLQQLKKQLSDGQIAKLYRIHGGNLGKNADDISIHNMVVFKVDVKGLELFDDVMLPSKLGTFRACFTKQNIHPDRLTLINY